MVSGEDWTTKTKPRLILTVQSLSAVGLPFEEAVSEGIRVSDAYRNVTSIGTQARLLAAVGGWYQAAVAVMAKRIDDEEGKVASDAFIKDMAQMTKDVIKTGIYRTEPIPDDPI